MFLRQTDGWDGWDRAGITIAVLWYRCCDPFDIGSEVGWLGLMKERVAS